MRYCRMSGTSDVYAIATGEGWWCCSCHLGHKKVPPTAEQKAQWKRIGLRLTWVWSGYRQGPIYKTRRGLLNHLQRHIASGQRVPKYALKRLQREIKDEQSDTQA